MGLAIVKNIVTSHSGYVRAESEGLGKGSRFIVGLPLAASPASVRTSDVEPGAPSQTSRNVLIVDDDEDNATMLASTMSALGHRIRVAHDGQSALAIAHDQHPDVALLDIGLPGMDGYELAARLRELPGGDRIRLVAITGYGQARDREASARSGFTAHLVKPVDLSRLREILVAK